MFALCLPAIVIAYALMREMHWHRHDLSVHKMRPLGKGFADYLTPAALVQPGIILNKDGSLMAGWEFRGEDATSKTLADMRRRVAHLNKMFVQRDVGWMFHVDVIRRPAPSLSARAYHGSDAARVLDEERLRNAGPRFANRYVFVATYLPPTDNARKATNLFVEQGASSEESLDRVYAAFSRGLADIEDTFGQLAHLRRLGARYVDVDGREVVQDELLEHLVSCIYGEDQTVTVPRSPLMLSGFLAVEDLYGGFEPRLGTKHIRVITITGFPIESLPSMLDRLSLLEIPLRFSTRVIVEDTVKARKKLDQAYANWFGKRQGLAAQILDAGTIAGRTNLDAERMMEDVDEATALADRGLIRYGYYTACVVLMDENQDKLTQHARAARKALQKLGFLARIEDINAIDAYLGTHPGNGWHNVRKYMLSSINVGDMLPTTSEWRGRETIECPMCEPGTQPIAIVKTLGNDDFSLDLHLQDVMHALIAGPPGAGKTTLVNFLNANFMRSDTDQVIGIDYGYGMYRTCAFLGGDHFEPNGDGDGLQFALFKDVAEANERAWLADYLETLVELNGVQVHPAHRERLEKALELMVRTPAGARSLTTYLQKISDPTGELKMALRPYAVGGSLGQLLDGTHDTMCDSRFQVYELSHVMGQKEKTVVPVLLLLFHRIEARLRNNHRTWIPMDEAWLYLDSPSVAPKVREQLKTFRKLHAGVGIITQSLTDVMHSSIRDTVIDACKTRLLLPNPDASGAHLSFYRLLGMNDQQINRLAKATPKRQYWLQSQDGNALLDLGLTKAELAVYAGGSTDDIALTRRLQRSEPDAWREELMRLHGLDGAALRFAELRRAHGDPTTPFLKRSLAIA